MVGTPHKVGPQGRHLFASEHKDTGYQTKVPFHILYFFACERNEKYGIYFFFIRLEHGKRALDGRVNFSDKLDWVEFGSVVDSSKLEEEGKKTNFK